MNVREKARKGQVNYREMGGSYTSPIDGLPYSYSQRAIGIPENENALYYEIEILKDLPIKGITSDITLGLIKWVVESRLSLPLKVILSVLKN